MKYKDEYLAELAECKDSFTPARYRWLENLVREDNISLDRFYISYGYVMAVKDAGNYVGDLKLIMEMMRGEIINERI